MLIGRNYKLDKKDKDLKKVTPANHMSLVGKYIFVRSPILCKNPGVCTTCYGDMSKEIDSRFIGVIAAQSLGECNTQLVLRTFHTSGVAIVKDGQGTKDGMKQQDIVSDLGAVSKMLHQFPKNTKYEDLVEKLYSVYNENRAIHHVHFECVVAQLMWKKHDKWRLLKNRDEITPEFYSVQKVPSVESWLLGLAFSNPKRHILTGIFNSGKYVGVLDNILRGEIVE